MTSDDEPNRQGAGHTRRAHGALEAAVLEALWAAGAPMTPRDVQRALGQDLAYTTVLTILARLHDKQTVTRYRRGRSHAYEPVSDEAGLAAHRMRKALEDGPDRDTVLTRFVDDLSRGDEEVLRRLLDS